MAGIYLHKHIVQNMPGISRDSDHVDIWHLSDVARMPDRSDFLSGKVQVNPADIMAENILGVGEYLHSKNRKWVVAIPCATFHAPKIFDRFCTNVEWHPGCIQVLNMVEETINFIQQVLQKIHSVGVLATQGSVDSMVWSKPFEYAGYQVFNICDSSQHKLHKAIYNHQYGLKCKTPPSIQSQEIIYNSCMELIEKGAEAIILGCTELPLVQDYLIENIGKHVVLCDPLKIMALVVVNNLEYIDQGYSSHVLWKAMT